MANVICLTEYDKKTWYNCMREVFQLWANNQNSILIKSAFSLLKPVQTLVSFEWCVVHFIGHSTLTSCNESHHLLGEFIFFSSGGHPQGKKTIRTRKNWSTSKNSVSLFSPAVVSVHHFFFPPKEDNKRRQAILRVKSKVNCSQENVNQFYRSATRDMWPLVGGKRCQNICTEY